jgi:hypothetical protein
MENGGDQKKHRPRQAGSKKRKKDFKDKKKRGIEEQRQENPKVGRYLSVSCR